MADCNHDEPFTPEMDDAVARAAIAEGDLPHAAHHVATAIGSDPLRADRLALLDTLVKAAGGPSQALALFPLVEDPYFGIVAVHARLLGPTEPGRALDLLCQVALAKPEVPFLEWAKAFVADVPPQQVADALGRLLGLQVRKDSPEAAATFLPALALVRLVDSPEVSVVGSMLARRVGNGGEALSLALSAHGAAPSWRSAVALANAHRDANQFDEAVAAWEHALRFEPDDVSVRLDWADALLERHDYDGARGKYLEVLAYRPEHAWATPSVLYADWGRNSRARDRLVLTHYADQHPDNPRARDLADRATPWLGRLPRPQEALVNAASQMFPDLKPELEVRLTLSHPEAPCAVRALHRTAAMKGATVHLTITYQPSPDPREPRVKPPITLWKWSGEEPTPALPPPSPLVGQVLGELAAAPFHAVMWLQHGQVVAKRHGLTLDAAAVRGVLAGAIEPPPAPQWAAPWDWAYLSAHAAAFLLAGTPGWKGTAHRDGLLSMLAVRNDWVTIGAVVALGERGRTDKAVRAEVEGWLMDTLKDGPDGGYWCVAWPVACALLRLGQNDNEALRHALSAHLGAIEDPKAADA